MKICLSILIILIGFFFVIKSLVYYNQIKGAICYTGVAVKCEEINMATTLSKKFKKDNLCYKTLYQITSNDETKSIIDPDITSFPVVAGTEKNFYFEQDDLYFSKPYSMEFFKKQIKTGGSYILLGGALLIFDFAMKYI